MLYINDRLFYLCYKLIFLAIYLIINDGFFCLRMVGVRVALSILSVRFWWPKFYLVWPEKFMVWYMWWRKIMRIFRVIMFMLMQYSLDFPYFYTNFWWIFLFFYPWFFPSRIFNIKPYVLILLLPILIFPVIRTESGLSSSTWWINA